MIRRRSYSIIFKVQRIILLVFFTTTVIAVSIPVARLVTRLSPGHLFPLVATLLLFLAGMVVIGSVIHVISYIPFNLASSFDPVKNRVATGEILHMDQLGKEISAVTTDFFNFSFLDIRLAFLHTEGSDPVSHQDISPVMPALESLGLPEKSKYMEEIISPGRIEFEGEDYHLYVLPVWIGNKWLGYMGLLSKRRIIRFFREFLMEYENNFLDDQILVVMNRQMKL